MAAGLTKSQVRKIYGKFAVTYDLWGKLTESRARKRSLELARIKNGEHVLEVAVGTGLLFVEVLKRNPEGRNEGIDLTEAMLNRAKVRAEKLGVGNFHLTIGDAYHLQFPEDSFDLILNNYMFDLIPERDFLTVLTEFKRVLRHGGRIVLVNMTRGQPWFNRMWDWLYAIRPSLLGGCRGVELTPYVKAAGFDEIRREYLSQLMFPSEIIYAVKP